MLDREDIEALKVLGQSGAAWGMKLLLGIVAILCASFTLGMALRLFEAARG